MSRGFVLVELGGRSSGRRCGAVRNPRVRRRWVIRLRHRRWQANRDRFGDPPHELTLA